jgi:hypothetical protein
MQVTDAGNTLVFSDTTPEEKKRILSASKPAPAPLETGNRTQVAKIFSVHPGSLKRWEKAGKLHPIKITARTLRYDMREIRAILEGAK